MNYRFSVIVPAYNEAKYLPRLLDSLKTAADNFGPGLVETIVADNASTDSTQAVAEAAGCKVAMIGKRSIAAARNGGAEIASGEIFCFIDADSAVHPDTFIKIDEAMRDHKIVAGSTGLYLERMSFPLLIVYVIMHTISRLTCVDAGVVFCRREDFEAIGGYDEEMLLAEDVNFLYDLKRLGRRKGQHLTRVKGVRVLGSTRKFDEHGDWHYFTLLYRVTLAVFRLGFRVREGHDKIPEITNYWYRPDR